MTVPTQPVTIKLADFGGPSAAGITVTARASDVDYTADGTFVGTDPVTGVTDANGQVVLNLFPNAITPTGLGTQGTTVRVTAQLPSSQPLDVLAAIPNTPANLVNCLVDQDPVTGQVYASVARDAAAAALADRQLADADAAQTTADRAATGADRTQTGADRAQTGSDRTATTASAAAALVSQNSASTSAAGAAGSATSAQTSANAALANGHIYSSTTAAQGDGTLANGSYYAVPQASPATTFYDLYLKVSNVASAYVNTYPSLSAVQDQILKLTASVGDVYALGTQVAIGDNTPTGNTYPFTDSIGPQAAFATRGFLVDFNVRIAGGAGTGEVHIYVPDANSQYGYTVKAIVPVNVVNGLNTFPGSSIYAFPLPVGTRVHYRALTGGNLTYNTGGPVKRNQGGAQTVGNAVVGSILDYAEAVAVSFDVRPATTSSLDTRVGAIEGGSNTRNLKLDAVLGMQVSAGNTTYGNTGLTPTAAEPSGNFVYGIGPTTAPCVLSSVTLPTLNPFSDPDGTLYTAQLVVTQPDANGNQVVSNIWTIYLAPGKSNVISGFGELVLAAGSYVAINQTNARCPIQYQAGTTGGGGVLYASSGALTVGQTVPFSAYGNTPIFSYTAIQAANAIGVRVTNLEAKTATLAPPKNATSMVHQRYTGSSLPAGWTQAGGWTVSEGLISPATGGWGVYAITSSQSSIASRSFIARIIVNATNAVFGICAKPPAAQGAVAMVDGAAGFLKFYSWDGSTTPGTVSTSVALPAALVVGRIYTLEVEKVGLTTTITWTDTVTQQSCTLTETQNPANRQWHGQMGVMYVSGSGSSGDIKVDTFDVDALVPKTLRAIIVGDSICEGNNLPLNSPTWAFQIKSARFLTGDIMVAARAGDTTAGFINRKPFDLTPWLPRYVVLALGTNDTDQAVWRTNIAQDITDAIALGAEPILCTQVPRADGTQALRTAMNADIRAMFFGRYRYIDFAYAVSQNNDGVTWNAAYNLGDNVHPNYAGQLKMYAQVQADAPFLVR